MNDFISALPAHEAFPYPADRISYPIPAAAFDAPVLVPLDCLLNHLGLTPDLTLMVRIKLRSAARRPQVHGKGIAVPNVLRAARRCRTRQEVLEFRPGLNELDVAACLAYDQKVCELRRE